MKGPKISVIAPVYNAAKYLPNCIKSLLLQTYDTLEIIAVNNGSTDNSLSILEEFANKDKRIKIVNHPHNQGLSITRNTGMKHATGEYVSFLDADDRVSLCLYEKFVKDIQKFNELTTQSLQYLNLKYKKRIICLN